MTLMGMEIGGAETHVLELSKTLQRMGLSVHVVSNGGVYVNELEECGITHYRVPLHNKQFINMFSSYKALRKIIEENEIRLVHAHARIPAFICGLLKKRLGFTLVTTAHFDFSVAFPFNYLSNWGDATLTVSGDIKEYLLKNYNVDEKHIRLTVNGVDTAKFAPGLDSSCLAQELGVRDGSRKIVSVSRLDMVPSVPVLVLLAVAERLAARFDIEIVIVGDGDNFSAVKDMADGVNKRMGKKLVHLTGRRTDINRFMALADVFVNVSRAALEAMSAGTPVVLAGGQGYLGVVDENVISRAIETNFTCRGFGETTAEKLFADLCGLLERDSLTALGEYGRRIAVEEYSLERMAKDAINIYEYALEHRQKPVSIVISGYYGYNNSGDDIMLKSIIENLRARHGGLNMTVLSLKPKETRARFDVGAVYRFNLLKIFWHLKKADLLITGGGNLIQDETSTQSLIYYLWVINAARRLGTKNMLYAKGIGPVSRSRNLRRVRRSLCRVELITLRESDSLEVIEEMGIKGPCVHVTADAAFALPPVEGSAESLNALGINTPYFCVAIRAWMNNPADLEAHVARFADHMCDTYGYHAVFVPMRPEQDNEISRRVMSLMRNAAVMTEPSPVDFNRERLILGNAAFALCMRLHGLIYAMEKGVPAIGLVYSPKISQFMESIGQHWHVPVEGTDAKLLIKYADEIHADKSAISEEILRSANQLRLLASKNAELCIELIGMS